MMIDDVLQPLFNLPELGRMGQLVLPTVDALGLTSF